ncbi:4849_t:CDS:2 [Entrophospora sp. SA101]|nr:5556_t:CDS:2 [Entrophospora sp. SA101]CAJ0907863.1 4849_t:CDS:2 [Entrophospora sp. SA101]
MTLSLLFIPRNRKVDFDVEIIIEELLNVPLISGLYYVKWKLKHGSKSNKMTHRAPVKDHSVRWQYKLQDRVQLVIGKDNFLLPCALSLSIKQELNGGKEINNIGRLKINLSEYVGSTVITRHYLLQESKINSTLKKTQIYSGLTGIISDRDVEDDEVSIVGLSFNFEEHYLVKSRSTSSLRSAYYAQANHTTPITSSLAANNFLLSVGGKSSTDVIEEIFKGNDPNNVKDDDMRNSAIIPESLK